jgi:hypothetical protein
MLGRHMRLEVGLVVTSHKAGVILYDCLKRLVLQGKPPLFKTDFSQFMG